MEDGVHLQIFDGGGHEPHHHNPAGEPRVPITVIEDPAGTGEDEEARPTLVPEIDDIRNEALDKLGVNLEEADVMNNLMHFLNFSLEHWMSSYAPDLKEAYPLLVKNIAQLLTQTNEEVLRLVRLDETNMLEQCNNVFLNTFSEIKTAFNKHPVLEDWSKTFIYTYKGLSTRVMEQVKILCQMDGTNTGDLAA